MDCKYLSEFLVQRIYELCNIVLWIIVTFDELNENDLGICGLYDL